MRYGMDVQNSIQNGTLPKDIKIKNILEVRNEAQSESAELFLYGIIKSKGYWDEEIECITAAKVREALNGITAKILKVHINSKGGDVFESIAISNLLKNFDAEIHVYIDGLAGSGGSIIACRADKVFMYVNSMMMVHKAWTYGGGNADDFRKMADDLDSIDSAVKATYESRFVGTSEELEELVKASTWINAKESKAFGFCDKIVDFDQEEDEQKAENSVENSVKTLFNKYNVQEINAKDTLFSKYGKGAM